MRHGLTLAFLLVPLAGCVVPPVAPYSSYPGAYPGPYAGAEGGYPGYAYNDGSPTLLVEGATLPLIFYGGGWGYWDGYHRWHRAPEGVGRHLEGRYPGGVGFRGYGGGGFAGRPEGFRGGYPAGGYPAGGGRGWGGGGGRPISAPVAGPRPGGGGFVGRPAFTPAARPAAAPAARPAREREHH